MSLSIHNIISIRAEATNVEGGNWIELTIDQKYDGPPVVLNLYVWGATRGMDKYAMALAEAINAVPVPVLESLEDENV